MANVQKENGYTPIANEIIEQLVRLPLNGTQLRIIAVVWRYTYGFSRKQHELSISFIRKSLGLETTQYKQVTRELKRLLDMKILIEKVKPNKNKTRVIAFNKNHDLWIKQTTGRIRPEDELDQNEGTKKTREPLDELDHQENNIKTKYKTSTYTPEFEEFYKEYPRAEEKRRTFTNWKKCLKQYKFKQLMTACNNYKSVKEGTEKQFLKTSANFLGKDKVFEDYIDYQIEEPKKIMAGGISY